MQLILTPRPKVIVIFKELSFSCGNAGSLTEPKRKFHAKDMRMTSHLTDLYKSFIECTKLWGATLKHNYLLNSVSITLEKVLLSFVQSSK